MVRHVMIILALATFAGLVWRHRDPEHGDEVAASLLEGDEFERLVATISAADRAMPERQRFYR